MTRLLGVHEAKPAAHRFPGAPWGREFVAGPNGTPLPESTSAEQLITKVRRRRVPHLDAGGDALISIKLPLDSVRRARWDSRLQALGEYAGDSLAPVKLIINHEPENDTDDIPASVFVAGFNRARQEIRLGARATSGASPEVCYAAMAYQWRHSTHAATKDAKAWLGGLEADRFLADAYFGKSFPQTTALPDHPGLKRFVEHLPESARIGLAEYGRLAHRHRASMFATDFAWLASDRPLARRLAEVVLVWNTAGTERNAGWLLDGASEMAVRAGLAGLAS